MFDFGRGAESSQDEQSHGSAIRVSDGSAVTGDTMMLSRLCCGAVHVQLLAGYSSLGCGSCWKAAKSLEAKLEAFPSSIAPAYLALDGHLDCFVPVSGLPRLAGAAGHSVARGIRSLVFQLVHSPSSGPAHAAKCNTCRVPAAGAPDVGIFLVKKYRNV